MLKKFQKHLEKKFDFLKDNTVLIACSGGLDSTVLAHLFQKLEIKFALAHCNFTLRSKESDLDETFVKNLGSFLNCPVHVKKFKTTEYANKNSLSIQMAARELRYNWFKEIRKKHNYKYTLTAHHKDDVLETVLINFTRGTGLDGLTGIPEINGNIIRPLLPFSREEIKIYAEKHCIIWREDESNSSTKYYRNKIRHEIVPVLKELNPNFFKSFDNTLNNLKESKIIVKDRIDSLKKHVLSYRKDGIHSISIKKIMELNNPKANLYEILKPYGFSNLKDISHLLKAESGKQLLSKSHRLIKNREELLVSKYNIIEHEFCLLADNVKEITSPIHLKFVYQATVPEKFSENKAYIDKAKLKQSLSVRKWQKGDYFYPIGMKGKKKLSHFFNDLKLSLIEKENIWLLCEGDSIVWVIGKRMDDRYKITKETTTIVEIKYTS